jgi:hypothetical protein
MFPMRKGIAISKGTCWLAVLLVAWCSHPAQAAEMTALELAKEGNRYLGEESKDKIVQIRSEKSIGSLIPNIWYLVYYDPDAPLMAAEVKFGGGRKLQVKRPARILEPAMKAHRVLDRDRLKVDSDRAIEITRNERLLANLTLKATRLTLERLAPDDDLPVWKVRVWAARLKNPNESVDIGEVWLSADDGKVIRNDLRPSRVD